MAITCQDLLNATADRECLEQFLRFLPESVKTLLATATDSLTAIAQVEQVLSFGVDDLLARQMDLLDEKLSAYLLIFNPLFQAIDQVAQILLPFSPCYAVGQLISMILGPIVEIENFILSASNRKKAIKDAVEKGASKVVEYTLAQFNNTAISDITGTIKNAQEYLEGVRACIGAVGAIKIPPGSPADQINDLIAP